MKILKTIHRRKIVPFLGVLGVFAAGHLTPTFAGKASRSADAIWVHDSLYGTVGTDTSFSSPPIDSTDVIFSFMDSGLMRQRSVAVYAPGDTLYNGGRWNVMAVTFTAAGKAFFDPDNDGKVNFELTSAEDLLDAAEMGYLIIAETGVYFECPLLPQPMPRQK